MGPIGSSCRYLLAFLTDRGVYVRAGCWWGTLADFGLRIDAVYPDGAYGDEYRAACLMIGVHVRLWTPAVVATEPAPVESAPAETPQAPANKPARKKAAKTKAVVA